MDTPTTGASEPTTPTQNAPGLDPHDQTPVASRHLLHEITLFDAPVRVALTLRRAEGTPEFCRRLSALGLRRGAQVRVTHRTVGRGRVVEVAGAHIALDRGVLQHLFAEALQ